jgi:nucleoside-diphosphate-sugar epimerase
MPPVMTLPRVIVTGASGFVGRYLLDALKEEWQIFAIARRSQAQCGALVHPNIAWEQIDIGDREALGACFERIREGGGAEFLIHLAAYYDFTGDENPEYWRTNIGGLTIVLDLARRLAPKRFVFASSLAACNFPKPGEALNERSPSDGTHVYALAKHRGEAIVKEYERYFPTCVVRFAALFSDWCEYPPLFVFLHTWLSDAWNCRILGGKGQSAVPYLHVRDAVSMVRRVMERHADLEPGEILIASPDGAFSHLQLFEAATLAYFGQRHQPIFIPRWLCRPGMRVRDVAGRLLGDRPFERPWMADYIDLKLTTDAHHTRARLGWSPRPRLEILRRMPFLIENFKQQSVEWNHINNAAMTHASLRANLLIHRLLEKNKERIRELFTESLTGPDSHSRFPSYQRIRHEERDWNHRLVLRNLMNAVITQEKAVFMAYCHDLAMRRLEQGFGVGEVCDALSALSQVCTTVLKADPESEDIVEELDDYIGMTIQFGIDRVQDVFEARLGEEGALPPGTTFASTGFKNPAARGDPTTDA